MTRSRACNPTVSEQLSCACCWLPLGLSRGCFLIVPSASRCPANPPNYISLVPMWLSHATHVTLVKPQLTKVDLRSSAHPFVRVVRAKIAHSRQTLPSLETKIPCPSCCLSLDALTRTWARVVHLTTLVDFVVPTMAYTHLAWAHTRAHTPAKCWGAVAIFHVRCALGLYQIPGASHSPPPNFIVTPDDRPHRSSVYCP